MYILMPVCNSSTFTSFVPDVQYTTSGSVAILFANQLVAFICFEGSLEPGKNCENNWPPVALLKHRLVKVQVTMSVYIVVCVQSDCGF